MSEDPAHDAEGAAHLTSEAPRRWWDDLSPPRLANALIDDAGLLILLIVLYPFLWAFKILLFVFYGLILEPTVLFLVRCVDIGIVRGLVAAGLVEDGEIDLDR
jgi:hypothetical protein